MEAICVSCSRSLSSSLLIPSSSSSWATGLRLWMKEEKRKNWNAESLRVRSVAECSGETSIDDADRRRSNFAAGIDVSASTTTSTAINQGFGNREAELAMWEKLGAVVRLSYGIGVYVAMALAGNFICSVTGVDSTGGFRPALKALVEGLGYAAPPIMALLFILDDEVVKYSPHARAIRDVEDEELRSFFYGMSPWQFILIVIASSIGEELFYRVAVQGSLADIFLRGTELTKDAHGIASLTGMLPFFVPFAQAFAAVITATLTGSLYYVATAPRDPTYVVAPVLQSGSGHDDLKKLFAVRNCSGKMDSQPNAYGFSMSYETNSIMGTCPELNEKLKIHYAMTEGHFRQFMSGRGNWHLSLY